jgi:hypothetical protein
VPVLAVPLVALPGAPQAAAEKLWAQVVAEVKTRPEVALTEVTDKGSDLALSANRGAAEAEKAAADARGQVAKAQDLARKGKAVPAAAGFLKAITLLLARPLTVDETGGLLLTDATAQLAVARMISGNDEGGDEALADLVRRAPDKAPSGGDYPPAFLRAYDAARQRVLSGPRGTLRVLAPTEAGVPARVLLDGRHLGAAPLQLSDVPSGVHVVRVERPGEAWAETVTLPGGGELLLQPRLGTTAATPVADLAADLARGQLDRPTAAKAARLARSKGAQAALVGTVAKERDGLAARSFLVLVKGERVVPLSAMTLDAELLGASLEVLRLADDLVARLAAPPPEPPLPLPLGTASADALEMPSVAAAPPPPEGGAAPVAVSSSELARAAGVAPSRAVLTPGAAPAAAPAPAAPAPAPAPVAAAEPAPAVAATPPAPAPAEAAESAPAARRVSIPGQAPAPAPNAPPAAPKVAVAAEEEAAAPRTPAAPRAPVTAAAPAPAAPAPTVAAPAPAAPAAPSAAAAPAPSAAAPSEPAPRSASGGAVLGSLAAATEALSATPAPAAPPSAPAAVPNPSPAPVAAAPAPAERKPVLPGAAPAEAPGELVIPRRATRDDDEPTAAPRARAAPVAATRMEAREASEIAQAKEPVKTKSHTVLWIVAGVLLAGGLGAGGYALYQGSRTANSATVTASWSR